jgi:phage-related protein
MPKRGLTHRRSQCGIGLKIARVIFAVEGNTMYLLHGFIKTTPKTAPADLALAQKRWKQIKP